MGSVSILFILSSIEFHYCLAASVVRVVVLRHGVLGLRLVLHLRLLRRSCEVCYLYRVSVTASWWLLLLGGSRVLEQSPSFHPHQAACVRSLRGFRYSRRTLGYCLGISCSSAFLAFVLGVFCRNMLGAGAMYASRFAVAAACRVCESVTVEGSVDSARFDAVSGVAVAASEEYTVNL